MDIRLTRLKPEQTRSEDAKKPVDDDDHRQLNPFVAAVQAEEKPKPEPPKRPLAETASAVVQQVALMFSRDKQQDRSSSSMQAAEEEGSETEDGEESKSLTDYGVDVDENGFPVEGSYRSISYDPDNGLAVIVLNTGDAIQVAYSAGVIGGGGLVFGLGEVQQHYAADSDEVAITNLATEVKGILAEDPPDFSAIDFEKHAAELETILADNPDAFNVLGEEDFASINYVLEVKDTMNTLKALQTGTSGFQDLSEEERQLQVDLVSRRLLELVDRDGVEFAELLAENSVDIPEGLNRYVEESQAVQRLDGISELDEPYNELINELESVEPSYNPEGNQGPPTGIQVHNDMDFEVYKGDFINAYEAFRDTPTTETLLALKGALSNLPKIPTGIDLDIVENFEEALEPYGPSLQAFDRINEETEAAREQSEGIADEVNEDLAEEIGVTPNIDPALEKLDELYQDIYGYGGDLGGYPNIVAYAIEFSEFGSAYGLQEEIERLKENPSADEIRGFQQKIDNLINDDTFEIPEEYKERFQEIGSLFDNSLEEADAIEETAQENELYTQTKEDLTNLFLSFEDAHGNYGAISGFVNSALGGEISRGSIEGFLDDREEEVTALGFLASKMEEGTITPDEQQQFETLFLGLTGVNLQADGVLQSINGSLEEGNRLIDAYANGAAGALQIAAIGGALVAGVVTSVATAGTATPAVAAALTTLTAAATAGGLSVIDKVTGAEIPWSEVGLNTLRGAGVGATLTISNVAALNTLKNAPAVLRALAQAGVEEIIVSGGVDLATDLRLDLDQWLTPQNLALTLPFVGIDVAARVIRQGDNVLDTRHLADDIPVSAVDDTTPVPPGTSFVDSTGANELVVLEDGSVVRRVTAPDGTVREIPSTLSPEDVRAFKELSDQGVSVYAQYKSLSNDSETMLSALFADPVQRAAVTKKINELSPDEFQLLDETLGEGMVEAELLDFVGLGTSRRSPEFKVIESQVQSTVDGLRGEVAFGEGSAGKLASDIQELRVAIFLNDTDTINRLTRSLRGDTSIDIVDAMEQFRKLAAVDNFQDLNSLGRNFHPLNGDLKGSFSIDLKIPGQPGRGSMRLVFDWDGVNNKPINVRIMDTHQ